MKVSLNWLKRYVDIREKPEVLARDLTMFGLNVEEVRHLTPPFTGVVYGKVIDVKRHPRADRLSVCTVDAGGDAPLNIVCGASNVRPGLGVPVALHGAVLDGGLKIKRTKIRGETSEGMICSEIELGIGDDAEGIIELDFEENPGTNLEGRLGSDDVILDIEVTPNRPDLLSHIGIAREIAALYKRELRTPELFRLERGSDFTLKVEDEHDCPRYTAAFVDDVTIGPSPEWMRELLTVVGLKPINNIVDITNFVLMEMGQPLHAFDRATLVSDTIIVRRAREDEVLVTLDGEERKLDPGILVIADAERAVALAGVMGGKDTEVTERTRRVLLESAMFEPKRVRNARQRLKLETEASYRFEREGDVGVTLDAARRACTLIEQTGAGRPVVKYAERVGKGVETSNKTIPLRVKQVNRLLGTHLAADEIASLIERLGLPSRISAKTVQVILPTFRRDLKEEVDLIEEAARTYGYDNIGLEGTERGNIFSRALPGERRNERICSHLASRGMAEVMTSSFMDPGDPERFKWVDADPRNNPIRIENPLTTAQSVLRTSLLPGLVAVVRRNAPAEREGLRIFELGKVFLAVGEGEGLPREELHLAALFTRKATPLSWMEKQRLFDFFDMKGDIEALLGYLGVASEVTLVQKSDSVNGFIFNWLLRSEVLAEGGLLSRSVTRRYDIEEPVYFFDMLMDVLPAAELIGPRYRKVSLYPAVKRDLCVVAGERVNFADIRNKIIKVAKNLDSIQLFDYYREGHLGEGKRSYTFRLVFRSPDGTLDDSAADREIERVLDTLQRDLQVTLRTE